ncbi:cytidine deaminase [Corynebacterium uropygiale]|uniref:Cytidine deaminase n=1 Tax=Corynebacterium uropygiale TaxID=1775911 RepID=A0A9X1QRS0_9CORY|nr:cytidine deaminase [Corynebacterium uropygiale]MCF4006359.1 cytidine deaminase [Corynebacterium uropygiale]
MTSTTLMSDTALLDAAREVAHRAYVPYSHFPVGAALIDGEGHLVTGCNVENAAYGETICAERNAITTMVAQYGAQRISAIAVIGLKAAPCWPCGACRQVLREFQCERVIVEGPDGEPLSLPFEKILPYSFGPEALDEE